jgi:hypothetical protein
MMNYFILVPVVSLCLMLIFIVRSKRVERQEKQYLYQGLMLLKQIQKIVGLIQQHRGISIAIKQGNDKVKFRHASLQNEIDALLDSDDIASLKSFSQWQSFSEHWPRLKSHTLNKTLDTQSLMRQHSAMIEGQLSLIDDVTRDYHLHMIMLDDSIQMSEICIDTIRTTETIAQARGIGMGLCVMGKSEGADDIKLNFLKSSIDSTTSELFEELKAINNPDINTHIGSTSVSIKNSSDKLVNIIDEKILKQEKIGINAQDYFDLATTPIDDLAELFSQIIAYTQKKYTLEF